MKDNTLSVEILEGGIIKITTGLISDPAMHVEAERFVDGMEKSSGNKFTVVSKKQGRAHTHTHADGSQVTHQH